MEVKILNLNDLSISTQKLDVVAESLRENHDLIGAVLKWQAANRRGFSSASTKTRGELVATGKKPYKQKHTGQARQGSQKGSQFVGGAKTHGPQPRDFSYTMPKKAVKRALGIVVKDKIASGKVYVVSGEEELKVGTNDLAKKFAKLEIAKALIAVNKDSNFSKSVRNIRDIKLIRGAGLNVFDIMKYDFLLLDKVEFESVKEVLQ